MVGKKHKVENVDCIWNTSMFKGFGLFKEKYGNHAIDEYFPEKSTIHGIQVGWAHGIIAKHYRKDPYSINEFYNQIGLNEIYSQMVPWREEDFESLIPYARRIRNRYTIFNQNI